MCGRKIAGLTQSCKKYYCKRDAGDCVASAIIDAGDCVASAIIDAGDCVASTIIDADADD